MEEFILDTKELCLPRNLLETIKLAARRAGIKRIALTGGVIRDHLLHFYFKHPISMPKDLDLIIEGEPFILAKVLEQEIGTERVEIVRENKLFQTIEMKIDDFPVDVASAREDQYLLSAENPKTISTTIEKDLRRRDFTLNAIALELTSNTLIDLHNGRDSIKKRHLELIHPKSIEDDPTRIIRAARYASRLDLRLSPKSLYQVQSTLDKWPWHWKPDDTSEAAPAALSTRLRMELELLFSQEPFKKAIQYLQNWGALILLDNQLQSDSTWSERLDLALKFEISPLIAFIASASNPIQLAKRLQLAQRKQKILVESIAIQEFFNEIHEKQTYINWLPSDWCEAIEKNKWDKDSIAIAICLNHPLREPLYKWIKSWRLEKSPISANELITQGWAPGPSLKAELKRLRKEKLDGMN
ncbi:CCA tRNA nucleotidyltransferase [Prochlorococcus sp. MIT 1223]|uniref:CCA tRNA nucleotidyltransferase n=1 Tax=Prochlorococcus sp. MIT 1223 TaxID=3096217 RepID=UPI002A74F9A4|nr:CCA tRNA nucleotidyltransferase [Prochlorococcus sp. MIT 1223]